MTDKDKKLAEEILKKYFEPCGIDRTTERQDLQLAITLNPSIDRIIQAMQAYHEAANKQVTDEDIQAWADKKAHDRFYQNGMIRGAKAMRDGEIKPVSRDNDC